MRGRSKLRAATATLFALIFGAACADSTMPEPRAADRAAVEAGQLGPSTDYLLPPITVTVPHCDPWTDINWCQGSGGGGDCMTAAPGLEMSLSSCPGVGDGGGGGWDGGGGGGGGEDGGFPPRPGDQFEGPGAFAACVASLFVLMGSTAMMDPLAHGLYDARNAYHSTRREYNAVMANNPSLEMQLLYEHRLAAAKGAYNDAVQGYALGAGASVLSVIAAVAVCSPGLLLPTP